MRSLCRFTGAAQDRSNGGGTSGFSGPKPLSIRNRHNRAAEHSSMVGSL